MSRATKSVIAAAQRLRRGHPTHYDPSLCGLAKNYCLLGATDAELSEFFGISEVTLNAWKRAHPDFFKSIREGRVEADANVAAKLYHRATGYSHDAVKILQYEGQPVIVPYIEHYPPDTTAASLWLRNRQPSKWRDKTDVQHSGTITLEALVRESYGAVIDAKDEQK